MDNHGKPPEIIPQNEASAQRLERLSRYSADKQNGNNGSNSSYTNFIRRMRLILPLIAICIVVALLTWPDSQKTIALLEEHEKESLQTIRKNELTNPKFDSVDDKNQPYSLTAEKAVQADGEENIMILTHPSAQLDLNSGGWLKLEAENGKFWQVKRQLDLQNNVTMTDKDGYRMDTASLFIDLEAKTAETDTPVIGSGPAGDLRANGLRGDNEAGTLVFTGPAKLILRDAGSLQGLSMDNENNAQATDTDAQNNESAAEMNITTSP